LIELMVVVLIILIMHKTAYEMSKCLEYRRVLCRSQSDLRNGLTAEKTVYTDNQAYDATVATMKGIESSLDWGGKLTVVVGDAVRSEERRVGKEWKAGRSGTTLTNDEIVKSGSAG